MVHRRLSSLHLILERHAFRVILLKPCLGGFLARKDLQVFLVADLLTGLLISFWGAKKLQSQVAREVR